MVDLNLAEELELMSFYKHLTYIENQYLNLIYNDILDEIQERWIYEKTINLIEWKCAICGCDIYIDRNKDDVENFVCDYCKEIYNNDNESIDYRILKSRNSLYKFIENSLYDELESKLKGRSK